ncbi:MAG: methionyl-tRNA formyltransferase [Treponema sp.]|jgi:methionyl-tRNA formyltransferase|nr:methionyl-tRNA formyltransferase [Treponema sp.]
MMKKDGGFSAPLRVLFAGSPDIALPALDALAGAALAPESCPWLLTGVLTNPDRPKGRSGGPEPTAAAAAAERHNAAFAEKGLPPVAVLKPETLKAEAREAAAALFPDILVSFAYGRIFGPKFLSLFPLGGINIHPSLLPKYRGASPIQQTILNRDVKTGICVQKTDLEMDTGNILAVKEIPLTGRETTFSLSRRAGEEAAILLVQTLNGLARALFRGEPFPEGKAQEGEPSGCSRITRDSGIIDWNKSAEEIDAMIRAYTPWPLARTTHNGQNLFILEAAPYPDAPGVPDNISGNGGLLPVPGRLLGTNKKSGILIQTGRGILAVTRLQYQARKALPWQAFLNGVRDFIGARLTAGTRPNSEDT